MREVIFDTETTGVSPDSGDRIVEIALVEIDDLSPTGRTFHTYVNPERDMPEEARAVHGLSEEFLSDKPLFSDPSVVDAFVAFVGDAPLVAHNAEFDRRFLNAELKRLGRPEWGSERFVDTLAIARRKFPGAQNSLDALCRRFGISLKDRTLHGALVDTTLLAAVYMELRGGRERRLAIFGEEPRRAIAGAASIRREAARPRPAPLPDRLTDGEKAAHAAFVAGLSKTTVWAELGVDLTR
jgi:DNA polymerase III subunit epsilon